MGRISGQWKPKYIKSKEERLIHLLAEFFDEIANNYSHKEKYLNYSSKQLAALFLKEKGNHHTQKVLL